MKLRPKKAMRKEIAQALLEFALIVPLLLLIVYGLIEFGRLLAIFSMVTTASREGSRHGAAAGYVTGYIQHFEDCDGIRAAAKKQAALANVTDANIEISYDRGPGTSVIMGCPPPPDVVIHLGDRIIVKVVSNYQPLIPLVRIPPMQITSKTARTILKDVTIEGTLRPPEPTNTNYPTRTPVPPTKSPPPPSTDTPIPPDTETPTPGPSLTPTESTTPTPTGTDTPTSTPTQTPTATPACGIYDRNPLNIEGNPINRVSWQVLNQRPDTLVLSILTIDWPTNDPNAPKLDYIRFGLSPDPGTSVVIWDGNEPHSPATIGAWSGFESDRSLGPYPSAPQTVTMMFTRPLLPGPYSLTLTFHDVTMNIDCTVSTSRTLQP